jgi:hypothetical protein
VLLVYFQASILQLTPISVLIDFSKKFFRKQNHSSLHLSSFPNPEILNHCFASPIPEKIGSLFHCFRLRNYENCAENFCSLRTATQVSLLKQHFYA